jgi:hypothetical protein
MEAQGTRARAAAYSFTVLDPLLEKQRLNRERLLDASESAAAAALQACQQSANPDLM